MFKSIIVLLDRFDGQEAQLSEALLTRMIRTAAQKARVDRMVARTNEVLAR